MALQIVVTRAGGKGGGFPRGIKEVQIVRKEGLKVSKKLYFFLLLLSLFPQFVSSCRRVACVTRSWERGLCTAHVLAPHLGDTGALC